MLSSSAAVETVYAAPPTTWLTGGRVCLAGSVQVAVERQGTWRWPAIYGLIATWLLTVNPAATDALVISWLEAVR